MQISIFIFWKAMLQVASQNFPELNALNFFLLQLRTQDFRIHKGKLIQLFSSKLYSYSFKHSPILCTKLRVSKNVSIIYSSNDCDPLQVRFAKCRSSQIFLSMAHA